MSNSDSRYWGTPSLESKDVELRVVPICPVCRIHDSRPAGGRHKASKTCSSSCANILHQNGDVAAARKRWLRENQAYAAFGKFLYNRPMTEKQHEI